MNPRPQAFHEQFYMLSGLFWISPARSRSRTLPGQPVPLDLAVAQGTRAAASQCRLPCSLELAPLARPIGQPLQGSPVFKRRGRNVRRSQLVCFSWIYEGTEPRHALLRIRTHVETGAAPGMPLILRHRAAFQERDLPGGPAQPSSGSKARGV